MSEQKQGARPLSELPMAVRVKLEELLGKSKTALSPGEIDFLFGRREYLSKEQKEDFGLDKMKIALGAAKVKTEKEKEPEKKPETVVVNNPQPGDEEMVDHVVTEQDLIDNPELVEQEVKVGQTISIPKKVAEEMAAAQTPPAPQTPAAPEVNSKSNQRRVAAQRRVASAKSSAPAKKTNKKDKK